jgi:hypothetical protein
MGVRPLPRMCRIMELVLRISPPLRAFPLPNRATGFSPPERGGLFWSHFANKHRKTATCFQRSTDSLGGQSTWLLGALSGLWLRPAMRLGTEMFHNVSLGRRAFF